MHYIYLYGGLLLGGALATSLAEYKLNYNLVDYVVEFAKKVYAKVASIL